VTVYLLRRLIQAAGVVLAMSVIVFIGVYAIGDPVEILISPDADQFERERRHQGARPRPAALGAVPDLPRQGAARRPRPVLRVQRAGAEADPPADAGDA
jgi:hypothetical protein